MLLIYVLEKREWILFCHQNLRSVYCQGTNQLKLKNLDFDVPLLYLYPYVRRSDKYHWHIIEVRYLQPVVCRWYEVKRAVDQNWTLWYPAYYRHFIRIHIFDTDNKLSLWVIWYVPLNCIISKTLERHFLIKTLWSIVSNVFCKSNHSGQETRIKPFVILSWRYDFVKNLLSEVFWNLIKTCIGHCYLKESS